MLMRHIDDGLEESLRETWVDSRKSVAEALRKYNEAQKAEKAASAVAENEEISPTALIDHVRRAHKLAEDARVNWEVAVDDARARWNHEVGLDESD